MRKPPSDNYIDTHPPSFNANTAWELSRAGRQDDRRDVTLLARCVGRSGSALETSGGKKIQKPHKTTRDARRQKLKKPRPLFGAARRRFRGCVRVFRSRGCWLVAARYFPMFCSPPPCSPPRPRFPCTGCFVGVGITLSFLCLLRGRRVRAAWLLRGKTGSHRARAGQQQHALGVVRFCPRRDYAWKAVRAGSAGVGNNNINFPAKPAA